MQFNNQNTQNEIITIKSFMKTLDAMKLFMQRLLDQENAIFEAPKNSNDKVREITDLRLLSKSDHWPESLYPEEIVSTEEEKLHEAAVTIDNLITNDIVDKKILVFGCKEGHIGFVLNKLFGPKKVICYDIEDNNWNHFEKDANLIYTKNWDDVVSNGSYDMVIINDVIDHSHEFEKSLQKIITLKSDNCRIFVRCHPWCSRDGCHIHSKINKAYLHLVHTEDELFAMGIKPVKTIPLLNPLSSYKRMFQAAGLSVVRENIVKRDVELFFTQNPILLRRIKEKWQNSEVPEYANGTAFPREYLEIQYVDFTLM